MSTTSSSERISKEDLLQLARKLFPRYKDDSWKPIFRGVFGVAVFSVAAVMVDKKYFAKFTMLKQTKSGLFLISYLIAIFAIRVYESKTTSICLELLWGCNVALTISSIGCILGRPLLVGMAIGLVGLDQTLWYADVISFALRKKYVLGAAAYLSHPEQTFWRTLTSLHHLWFLPYAMCTLYLGKSHLHKHSFPLSMLLGSGLMAFSRKFTSKYVWFPFTKQVKASIDQEHSHKIVVHPFHSMVDHENKAYLEYMNLNCGHEFYPEVPLSFLHYCNESRGFVYVPVIAAAMTIGSYLPFALMMRCSEKYLFHP